MSDGKTDRRFADAARAVDGNEAMSGQEIRDSADIVVAADHSHGSTG